MGEALFETQAASFYLDGFGTVRKRGHLAQDSQIVLAPYKGDEFGGDCVARLIHHALESWHNGKCPQNRAQDYLSILALEQAVYESAAKGVKIKLPA